MVNILFCGNDKVFDDTRTSSPSAPPIYIGEAKSSHTVFDGIQKGIVRKRANLGVVGPDMCLGIDNDLISRTNPSLNRL